MSSEKLSRTRIFTDGACSGNPGPGGWASIIIGTDGKVQELGAHASHTTNNRMEMLAVIESLSVLIPGEPVEIVLDSSYVLKGATEWLKGWVARGGVKADGEVVVNWDLWKRFQEILPKFPAIQWRLIPGHSGIPGNERVDEISVAFSKGETPTLFTGPLKDYSVDIFQIPTAADRGKKYSQSMYISIVDGHAVRHSTWSACQARTHGKPKVIFKKISSSGEFNEFLSKWKLSEKDIHDE